MIRIFSLNSDGNGVCIKKIYYVVTNVRTDLVIGGV